MSQFLSIRCSVVVIISVHHTHKLWINGIMSNFAANPHLSDNVVIGGEADWIFSHVTDWFLPVCPDCEGMLLPYTGLRSTRTHKACGLWRVSIIQFNINMLSSLWERNVESERNCPFLKIKYTALYVHTNRFPPFLVRAISILTDNLRATKPVCSYSHYPKIIYSSIWKSFNKCFQSIININVHGYIKESFSVVRNWIRYG